MSKLNQISKIDSPSGLGAMALATIMEKSEMLKFFDNFNAFEVDSTLFEFHPTDGTLDVQTRGAGGTYNSKLITMDTPTTANQKFTGFDFTIDRSMLADIERGLKTADAWKSKFKKLIRSFGKGYDNTTLNGTGVADAFLGLSIMMNGTDNLPGHTITGVIDASADIANSTVLDLKTDTTLYDFFLEVLDEAIAEVANPLGLVMNRNMQAALTKIAYTKRNINVTLDAFNRRLTSYNDIPIFAFDPTIITNAETDSAGDPSTCTSIYIASPGEQNFSFVTNSGLEYSEPEGDFVHGSKFRGEIRGALKIEERDSIRRLKNIKIR